MNLILDSLTFSLILLSFETGNNPCQPEPMQILHFANNLVKRTRYFLSSNSQLQFLEPIGILRLN